MEVEATIKEYIVTEIMHEVDQDVLSNEAGLIEDGIIDSMNLIELVNFLENKFGIQISEEELDIDNFRTINALSNFVNSKI